MTAIATRAVSFAVRDVTGQKTATVSEVPEDLTLGEIIPQLLADLSLPENDASGALTYSLRRDSDGSVMNDTDNAVELADDSAVMLPSINAG